MNDNYFCALDMQNIQNTHNEIYINIDCTNILSMASLILGNAFFTDRFGILNKYSIYNIKLFNNLPIFDEYDNWNTKNPPPPFQ